MSRKRKKPTAQRRHRRRRRSAGRLRRVLWRLSALAVLAGVLLGAGWVVSLDSGLRAQFDGTRWAVPATVFARPLELHVGLPLTDAQLEHELAALEYRAASGAQGSGTWDRQGPDTLLGTRAFRHWDGEEPARRVRLRLAGGRVSALNDADTGAELALVRLDPARIGHIYPAHREDRLLVRLEEVPDTLVHALLAVEDRDFHRHRGLSPSAIARAAWANLRAGRVVQGGSTITQQLVKNFYLSSDRTFVRKLREAVMAVLLEWRYDKDEILEAYINEVFLLQDGERSVHGFALASEELFGEPLQALDLHQQALLVAMINGPSWYNPRRHPERARARRDLVLDVMGETGVVDAEAAAGARGRGLDIRPGRSAPRRVYPAFMDRVQRDLRRDYRHEDLQSDGLRIFTTLAPMMQAAAEDAVTRGMLAQEVGVQAAAVTVDAGSGEVLALVGGRDPRFDGFNRALDARRPIGSLVKPAVYLAALENPVRFGLGTLLDDAPFELEDERGEVWAPRNFDRRFRGPVPVVDALAHSLNVPTVRLGLDAGLPAVGQALQRLGVPAPRRLYPSHLLGTVELSPIEVAQMYQTLAGDGFRTPLRSVRAVTRQDGTPLTRYALATERAFEPAPVHLVSTALVAALREGTGRGVRGRLPEQWLLAGKTGTTGDGRDSWFAGYGADLVGVVWMGRDDNAPTGLTGATGALPLWAELMHASAPRSLELRPPEGIETVWLDPDTGWRSAEGCEGARPLPYVAGHAPEHFTACGRRRAGNGGGGLADWFRGVFR